MTHKKGFYEKYIKRPQDVICALLAMIVFSPVMFCYSNSCENQAGFSDYFYARTTR